MQGTLTKKPMPALVCPGDSLRCPICGYFIAEVSEHLRGEIRIRCLSQDCRTWWVFSKTGQIWEARGAIREGVAVRVRRAA